MQKTISLIRPFCLLGVCAVSALAQAPETILRIETQNVVAYFEDNADQLRWASTNSVTAASLGNFAKSLWIGDIVTVNGNPARGAIISQQQRAQLRPTPTGSLGTSDVFCNLVADIHLEILQADGTQVGSLLLSGIGGTGPALGIPSPALSGHFVVVGGTGAFLGVRGQASTISQTFRSASITENPINRQSYSGAGAWSLVVRLTPMTWPEVLVIVHSNDFTRINTSSPAKEGEILSVIATGLGPVRGTFEPGKPFPTSPLAVVNSPVDVLVNGMPAEVLGAVGYPGSLDGYQVNFRVPTGVSRGTASVEVTTAWIRSSPVLIAVQ
jgi:hypothetical protein